ncbi:cobalamin B12-binding domain-containing protein [Planococcus sp. SIMBA_160]
MNDSIQLSELFLQGQEEEALKYVQDFLESHSHEQLYGDLLTPAMYRIGELWEQNEISVAEEHLATAVCDFVLSATELRNKEKDGRQKAMIFGPEGEEHYIGLKMVASMFREEGYEVRYMGPNLPLDAALQLAADWQPDVVALSGALAHRLPVLKTYAEAFSQIDSKPAVLIGGRAVTLSSFADLQVKGAVIVRELGALREWIRTGKGSDDGTLSTG